MTTARRAPTTMAVVAMAGVIAACSADDQTGNPTPFGDGTGTGATTTTPSPTGTSGGGAAPFPTGGVATGGTPSGGGGPSGPPSAGAGGEPAGTGGVPSPPTVVAGADPGADPWAVVAVEQVAETCRLDPGALAAANAQFPFPWAIVRYGRLCHESPASATMAPAEAWSTTKTFGALVAGAVAHATRDIPRTGPGTGPFSDEDRVDHWLAPVPYNADALVAHVMAMVAHNASLAFGSKAMSYDTFGTVQINTLSAMLNAAIAQDTQRLGANLEEFTRRFIYAPLGMRSSDWSTGAVDKTFAFSWSTTVRDMARIGLLMLNGGVWSGERLVDEEWIYRMTHPAFEDGNTGYGYLTWLNSASNHHYGGIPGAPVGLQQAPQSPGPCAPVALHRQYPHGVSASSNCNYSAPHTCNQTFDVGVWQAVGLGGQVIQGHPGLDMVIVARDVTPLGSGPDAPRIIWDALRAAVVLGDPTFAGDDVGFCAAYGAGEYAPD